MMAAIELDTELLERRPDAVALGAAAARRMGVLLRPLERALAVSPPLTAGPEHFELIGQAFEHALEAVASAKV